ncbi:MAG: hypothetical protein ABH950_05330 [Candidatus Altiarchaeota archaeon]
MKLKLILVLIGLLLFSSAVSAVDCPKGFEFRRMSGVGCVQPNCFSLGGYWTDTGACTCGDKVTCSKPVNYTIFDGKKCGPHCPAREVTACLPKGSTCPEDKKLPTQSANQQTQSQQQGEKADTFMGKARDQQREYGSKEEEECDKQWAAKGDHMIGVITNSGDCDGQCELGWSMRAEGCESCSKICGAKANHAFSKTDSSDNQCTCVCSDGYAEDGDDCVKLNCPSNSEPKGNECKCKDGYKKGDDGKSCIAYDKKKALQDLLEERLKEAKTEKEKVFLQKLIDNLADVDGTKGTILGGWEGIANTINSVLNKGERPSIADILSIYKLHTLKDIKKWWDQGIKNSESDKIFESKRMMPNSQHALDDVLLDLKPGEHKEVLVEYTEEGDPQVKKKYVTIVKGPDGTSMYTLDGNRYFDGKDLDKKLDPSFFSPVSDAAAQLKTEALDTRYLDPDDRLMDMFSVQVYQEYNSNVEANKARKDQLKSSLTKKDYAAIVGQMKTLIENGYEVGGKQVTGVIDFLDYAIQTTGTKSLEADFSKAAVTYARARKDGKSQTWIQNNMRDQIFYGIGIKNADTFQANTDEQVLWQQMEKVYQRYTIYKNR